MKRLIKSEFKKILKLKMNVALIIIAIIGTIFSVGMQYNKSTQYLHNIQNESHENLSGVSLLKYVDEIRHQYAGEWTVQKSQQYLGDFQRVLKKYFTEELDEDTMLRMYGKNYQELVDKSLKKELTYKELHENNVANRITDDYESSQEEELVNLNLYYKQAPILSGYQYAYGIGDVSYESSEERLSSLLKSLDSLLLDKEFKLDELQIAYNDQYSKEEIKIIEGYLQERVQLIPTIFDSTVGNQMLINGLNESLWIPLICIMIILANTFGMEKQYQMEQLIYPTKYSHYKITIAKLLTGTLFSIGIMITALLLSIIFGYIIIPIHTWDIATFELYSLLSVMNSAVFTYKHILLSVFILSIVASLAVTTLTLGLSYITKNRFIVIVILFLYFGAIIFLNLPDIFFFSHPYTMSQALNYFIYDRMPYYVYNQSVVSYASITIVFWLVVLVGVYAGIVARARSQVARIVQ